MKIADIKVGESYAVDPWGNGSRGVRAIEVTAIVLREEQQIGRKVITRRMVEGIVRAMAHGNANRAPSVGAKVLVSPRALERTYAEQVAIDTAKSEAKVRVDGAVAALAAVGLEGDGQYRSETVILRLSVAGATKLARRLATITPGAGHLLVDGPL